MSLFATMAANGQTDTSRDTKR